MGDRMAAARKPDGLVAVIEAGNRLDSLRALRDAIAREMTKPDVPGTAFASLSRQLTLVLAEIADLTPNETKGTALDELDARRRSRGADPARRERPAR